jgi:hypothetical protein
MAFGGIIATGVMIIVLLVTGYLIMASLNYSVDSASASLATVRDTGDSLLHTSLVLEAGMPGAGYVDYNLTNTGKMPIDNITKMDVIVKTIADGSVTGCIWLPYEDSASADRDHWYILERPATAQDGPDSLSPGSMMIIRCVVGNADASDGLVTVSAPNGVKAAGYYRAP